MLKTSQAIFAVRDVKETINFYRDVLGFSNEWLWGDPVSYGGIHFDAVQVMFNRMPELATRVEGHQHHFFAENVDALHALHASRGAPIIDAIGNRPWNLREYTVRDVNGYHLRFAGPIKHEKPAGALAQLPAHIRIDDRLPDWAEYARLRKLVNWADQPEESRASLQASCAGVVAIDTRDNTCVGAARAMREGWNWLSIWDVMVAPSHQHQRIGQTVVARLLELLRQIAPAGSNVHLFTYSPDFYARLGFRTESCSMTRL